MGCTVSQVPESNIKNSKGPVENRTTSNGNADLDTGQTHISNGHLSQGNNPQQATANGVLNNVETNVIKDQDVKSKKDEQNRTLRGDISQRREARIKREKTLHEMLAKREIRAQKISELVMDEKERLSLSTLSRSRATSRTGSPRLHRDNQSSKSVPLSHATDAESVKTVSFNISMMSGDSMRPVTTTLIEASVLTPEPSTGRADSEDSLRIGDPEQPRPSALKSANGRRRKGEPKVRIVSGNNQIHPSNNQENVPLVNGHNTANKSTNSGRGNGSIENQVL